jgi:hypothetical protein
LQSPKIIRQFLHTKLALALPVTFLILFVTSLGIVSVTYYISVQKIGSQSQFLQVENAKQNFRSLDGKVLSTMWHPGSSATIELYDAGGLTKIRPLANTLTIEINDSSTIEETIYNASIGDVVCELPYSQTSQTGIYLQGDSRTIVNQTGSTQSQISIMRGSQHPEIHLSYRPIVSSIIEGSENGKMINNIRVYILNLNSSNSLILRGEIPLKIKCINTQLLSKSYEISYQPQSLVITSTKDATTGSVVIPISSLPQGAIVNVGIVIINIAIERWIK